MGTKYQVDGDDLTAIANKIRSKGGTSASLEFPDGFKDAVDAIQTGITPTGTKNISTNGTHDVTNYASANVAVPASAVDSGTKQITSNGTGQDVVGYAAVDVAVPNSYSPSDEGKVVQSGALVSQSSQNITENGTYDTTLKNEVVVNVSGGGGVTEVASGTFVATRTYTLNVFVGKKCPKTDFIFNVWLADGTSVTPQSFNDRIMVFLQYIAQKTFVEYDLSANGNRNATSKLTYPVYVDGTPTNRTPDAKTGDAGIVRQTVQASENDKPQYIIRNENGFTFSIYVSANHYYETGATYNWELLYIGDDPTNDIVEVP